MSEIRVTTEKRNIVHRRVLQTRCKHRAEKNETPGVKSNGLQILQYLSNSVEVENL